MKKIRIGSRTSKLAIAQASLVADQLISMGYEVEVIPLETTGDKLYNANLSLIGGKGLFLKELEEKLIDKSIDIAVHSMKDVPAYLPEGLAIPIVLPREDVRDCFISIKYSTLADMEAGSIVGTSSSRRRLTVLHKYPNLVVKNFRGNITTRLNKLENGEADGIILAYAGLKRLGLESHVREVFNFQDVLPAVSQGAIGVEFRSDCDELRAILAPLHCPYSYMQVSAEREFMRVLGGSCTVPLAAHAQINGDAITIAGCYFVDENLCIRNSITGPLSAYESLGRELGESIKRQIGISAPLGSGHEDVSAN